MWSGLKPIQYAVVKGDVLSQQIYSRPDMRESSDIDILIEKKNVRVLEQLLANAGFSQQVSQDKSQARKDRVLSLAYSHQTPTFHKIKFGFHLNVDINHDIFWGQYEGQRCSISEFLSDSQEIEIYGTTVKGLTTEKAFVQLILHHYKDMNSLYRLSQYNCIRTSMFRDIYDLLLYNRKRLTVEVVTGLAKKYGILPIVYYMLYYTERVFNEEFLSEYVSALKCKEGDELLQCFGLSVGERKLWNISFEKRLDNDNLWSIIKGDLNEDDWKKIELNAIVFT